MGCLTTVGNWDDLAGTWNMRPGHVHPNVPGRRSYVPYGDVFGLRRLHGLPLHWPRTLHGNALNTAYVRNASCTLVPQANVSVGSPPAGMT